MEDEWRKDLEVHGDLEKLKFIVLNNLHLYMLAKTQQFRDDQHTTENWPGVERHKTCNDESWHRPQKHEHKMKQKIRGR